MADGSETVKTTVVRAQLRPGVVIPAHPLALTPRRRLDERRQRALTRYYLAAGAGGVAVGVHTTQFAIRSSRVGLYAPVLELAADALREARRPRRAAPLAIAGISGPTRQAVREARLAADLGYHAGLLSLGALRRATVPRLVTHARAVADVIPLMGFYLQQAVGGRDLPLVFWRRFVEIENVVAIKIAPFDRYRTLDVVRAVAEAGRLDDIALYTGNDDHIILDLLTTFRFGTGRDARSARIVGGLLGQWSVWTKRAVEQFDACRRAGRRERGRGAARRRPPRHGAVPGTLLTLAAQLTDANGAIFDAANGFAGSIPGIHEVLRRQGLLAGTWCLDPEERLSPGQAREIDRVCQAYPHLTDDAFVAAHLDDWLA